MLEQVCVARWGCATKLVFCPVCGRVLVRSGFGGRFNCINRASDWCDNFGVDLRSELLSRDWWSRRMAGHGFHSTDQYIAQ